MPLTRQMFTYHATQAISHRLIFHISCDQGCIAPFDYKQEYHPMEAACRPPVRHADRCILPVTSSQTETLAQMKYCLIMNRDRGSCLMLSKLATALGYECDAVHNMLDGLRAAAAKQYDLVLIACLVQDRSCWVAHQAMKLLYRERRCPIVLGVLSSNDAALQQRCKSSGMAGVLVHPVTKAGLAAGIGATASAAAECAAVSSSEPKPNQQQCAGCDKRPPSPERAAAALQLGVLELQEAGPLVLGELNNQRIK